MSDESKRCGFDGSRIKGICCDVKNCAYHAADDCCMAGEITVGPSYASTGSDTCCATFKKNEEK